LAKNSRYDDPHYAALSNILSLYPSLVQIFWSSNTLRKCLSRLRHILICTQTLCHANGAKINDRMEECSRIKGLTSTAAGQHQHITVSHLVTSPAASVLWKKVLIRGIFKFRPDCTIQW
jgi:hypothetical protein